MPKYIVEIPVGFNYHTEIEAEYCKEALNKAIDECNDEHPFMDLQYERENAWTIKK
jgi:hypothetical protein